MLRDRLTHIKCMYKHFLCPATAVGSLLLVAGLVSACGVYGTPSVVGQQLDHCLERRGITNAPESQALSEEEALIPGAIARKGLTVPRGVSRMRFEMALRECGASDLHIGPLPITSKRLQRRIIQTVMCLNKNGYAIAAPVFSGTQPIINTAAIDTRSARWVATMFGCRADVSLDSAALNACMDKALSGSAKGNAAFERRLVELPTCLKRHAAAVTTAG